MSVITLTNSIFEKEVMESEKPVLIDFYADWCGPCKMVSPVVEKIAEENPDIKVCKVNVDSEPELAQKFGIASIPTLVVVKDGRITNQKVGAVSGQTILDMLK
ncbi:MAG: thioredoxin [Oscillospiraceae bacterium]|nr:thioredoxin [Oscillospiraceae bacterium]